MAEIRVMTEATGGLQLGKQVSTEIDEITESEIETTWDGGSLARSDSLD